MLNMSFEDHLCQIFDFGVEESCYWIVMKCLASKLGTNVLLAHVGAME